MEIKILQVFYDKNGLPYKDKERTVHYPITSGTFLGASNTTQIRFYYDQLDELNESTFVAVSKLPNGKIGSEILESAFDEELNENYVTLSLSQFYTQYKGDVYISLQGYQGGVKVEQDENGIYQIYGTPTIQATGSIKLSIAYAPTFIGSGQTENITLQRVLAELSTKLGIRQETLHVEELPTVGNPNVWYVINDDSNDTTKANIYIWNATTQTYVWVGDNTLNLGDYYTKEQGEQFESDIGNRVTSVENELSSVASGSPKGVYSTLIDLETAYPTGTDGIYIVSATGHWYYWNGTAWTDGGVYQATASTEISFYAGDNAPLFFRQVNGVGVKIRTYGSFNFYGNSVSVSISFDNMVTQLGTKAVKAEDNSYVDITIDQTKVLVLKNDSTLAIVSRTSIPSGATLLFGCTGYQNATNGLLSFALQRNTELANKINFYVGGNEQVSYYQEQSSGRVYIYVKNGFVVRNAFGDKSYAVSDFPTIFGSKGTYSNGIGTIIMESQVILAYDVFERTFVLLQNNTKLENCHIVIASNGWANLGYSIFYPKIIAQEKNISMYIGENSQVVYRESDGSLILRTYGSFNIRKQIRETNIGFDDMVSQLGSLAVKSSDGTYVDITIAQGKVLLLKANNTLAITFNNSIPDDDIILFGNVGTANATNGLMTFLIEKNREKADNFNIYIGDNAQVYYREELSSGSCYLYFEGSLQFRNAFGNYSIEPNDFPTVFGSKGSYSNGVGTIRLNSQDYLVFNLCDKSFQIVNSANLREWHIKIAVNGYANIGASPLLSKINCLAIKNPNTYFNSSLSYLDYSDAKVKSYCNLIYGKNNIDKLLFFTDPHLVGTNYSPTRLAFNIGTIEKNYNSGAFDFLVCGGDWLGANDTPQQACEKLGLVKGFMKSKFKDAYLLVGNHDTNEQGTIQLATRDLENLWYEGGKAYFSFKKGLARCYCFDTGEETSTMNTYRWQQVDWFANKLLENDDAYNLIFMHIICTASITNATIPSITTMADSILKVAQAYNNKTTITLNSQTYDFTNTTGYVKCCFAGHSHKDATGYFNNIPIILTINDSVNNNNSSFDMCLVDYDNNLAYCVRYGNGSDRTVDLTDGTLVE